MSPAKVKAIYFLLLAMDEKPSRRLMQHWSKHCYGKAMRTDEAHAFLRSQRNLGPVGVQSGSNLGPSPVLKSVYLGPASSPPGSAHARVAKVLELQESDATASSAPLSPPPEQPSLVLVAPEPPEPKADRRSPAQQVADDALALLRHAVSAELDRTKAMTWTAWRSRNRRAATSLAAAGRSAQEIAELHAEVSEREGRTVLSLAHLQTSALYGERESPEERRRRLEQEEWDRTRPPTVQELIAAGTLPPMPAKKPLAEVVPIRHAPNPQIAAFAASFGISL